MGFLDKLGRVDKRTLEKAAGQARAKLGEVVDQHGDQIARGIDQAARAADLKTGRKHSGAIRKGAAAAKKGLSKLETEQRGGTNDGDGA